MKHKVIANIAAWTASRSEWVPRPVLLIIMCACAPPAFGETSFLPYGSTQFQHDNNVFDLPNSATAVANNGDPRLSDNELKAIGGTDFNFLWDRERLYSTLEARDIRYEHFTYLNHAEFLAKVGLDWKLLSVLDGTFLGTIERSMAQFAQRDTQTALAINVDRHAIANFKLHLSPEWRLEAGLDYHNLDAPIQNYPNYGLTDTTEKLALKYIGFSNLTYGVETDFIEGHYRNAPSPGTYNQASALVTMGYAASGISTFNGAVGYTRRNQGEGQGDFSAPSGSIGYTRVLSGKTTITAALSRAVNSYIGAGGSEVDNTASILWNYQVTYKTGMSLSYQYVSSKFVGVTVPGSDLLGRTFHNPGASFRVNYQVLRWMSIQPYATYQKRSSNIEDFNYSSTSFGIQIIAKRPARPTR